MDADSFFAEIEDLSLEVSRASCSFFDDSFSSEMAATSTPRKASAKRKGEQSSKKQKVSGPNRLACSQCQNTYANERTLAAHVKMHAMKGAASRMPSLEQLKPIVRDQLVIVLTNIKRQEESSQSSSSLRKYCDDLVELFNSGAGEEVISCVSETFLNVLTSQNALFPSALRVAVLSQHNKLAASDFLVTLQNLLLELKEASPEVVSTICGYGVFKLFELILSAVFKLLQGKGLDCSEGVERTKRSSDRLESANFWQLTYHIGGSILNGILHKSRLFPDNEVWTKYGDVVNAKFLRQPCAANECSAEVRSFTERKERWALKHCNQESFDFFLILFDELMSLEECDGSLLDSVAEDHVFQHNQLIFLWDDLVGDELKEERSLDLLLIFVHSAAGTVRRGILKRRLNDELRKAYSSVGLRPRLAR